VEEAKIARITKLLLAGARMLSVHCGACESPLFQLREKIVCPVCGEEAKVVETKAKIPSEVESVLREKLDALAAELKREKDPKRISELLAAMKSIKEALEAGR
jgi:UPF0148 protein